jgi:hypothetical protein
MPSKVVESVLPIGAASEATLVALLARLPALLSSGRIATQDAAFDPVGEKMLAGTAREKLYCTTLDSSATGDWDLVETGSGMTISVGGGAVAGSVPHTVIASGTTASARTVFLSKTTFRAPVELRYQISSSQRIANNSLRIGLVEVDPVTEALLTDTSIVTAPAVLNARNAAMAEWSGTVATTGSMLARAGGSAIDTIANAYAAGYTTVATGTTPNWIAATIFSLSLERDRVTTRGWALNALTNAGAQFAADRVIPDPTKKYKVAVIVENGAVAPASSTDWRVHLVNLLDATRFDVSARHSGSTDATRGFPVTGSVVVSSATLAANSTVITNTAPIIYADTTTNLAAAATFTGTARDGGTTVTYQDISVLCASPTDGTLEIYQGAATPPTYRVKAVPVTANAPVEVTMPLASRYWQVRFINGSTAQTGSAFQITSMMRRI